jgi:DNA replication protein DnaC
LSLTASNIRGNKAAEQAQRYLVDYVIAHPRGWLTLWGDYGTAKTLTIQAIIAGLVRTGHSARFYRASQIEPGWFDDLHTDRSNAELYRELPILAIDELNKVNLRSDWIRKRFQDLIDYRDPRQ